MLNNSKYEYWLVGYFTGLYQLVGINVFDAMLNNSKYEYWLVGYFTALYQLLGINVFDESV
jgi:hypothetical protein